MFSEFCVYRMCYGIRLPESHRTNRVCMRSVHPCELGQAELREQYVLRAQAGVFAPYVQVAY